MLQGVARFFKKQSAEESAAAKAKQHADYITEHGAQAFYRRALSDLEDDLPLSRWIGQHQTSDSDSSDNSDEEEEGSMDTDMHANATVLASLQQEGQAQTAAREFRIAMRSSQ